MPSPLPHVTARQPLLNKIRQRFPVQQKQLFSSTLHQHFTDSLCLGTVCYMIKYRDGCGLSLCLGSGLWADRNHLFHRISPPPSNNAWHTAGTWQTVQDWILYVFSEAKHFSYFKIKITKPLPLIKWKKNFVALFETCILQILSVEEQLIIPEIFTNLASEKH